MTPRVLVAALGSTLRGDDGFGPALLARVSAQVPAGVDAIDFGTHGLALVQKLYDGYGALVLLDACARGREPGTVYVLRLGAEEPPPVMDFATIDALADAHLVDPARVVWLAQALRVLPPAVWLVGCEPASTKGHHVGLSAPVARALDPAARETISLVGELMSAG